MLQSNIDKRERGAKEMSECKHWSWLAKRLDFVYGGMGGVASRPLHFEFLPPLVKLKAKPRGLDGRDVGNLTAHIPAA